MSTTTVALDEIKKAPSTLRFASEEAFEAWCDEDTKADYVDGEIFIMIPESLANGRGETWFGNLLDLFATKHNLGIVFSTGNIQIRLRQGLRRSPDVIFVEASRAEIFHDNYIDGAPDFILEFVSPESAIRDWHEKYIEYEAAGVQEYWIADRQQRRIVAFHLGEDRRYHPLLPQEGKLSSRAVPGFWVKLEWFWQGLDFNTFKMAKEIGII